MSAPELLWRCAPSVPLMSLSELNIAIDNTIGHIKTCGPAEPRFLTLNRHLTDLLHCRAVRAGVAPSLTFQVVDYAPNRSEMINGR